MVALARYVLQRGSEVLGIHVVNQVNQLLYLDLVSGITTLVHLNSNQKLHQISGVTKHSVG